MMMAFTTQVLIVGSNMGGYNGLYDIAFDLGTSMETENFPFYYQGKELMFWAWKGDYVNLGSGAELGIYKRLEIFDTSTPHWLVDKDLVLPMSLRLEDNEENTIIDYYPGDKQWWITGFMPLNRQQLLNLVKEITLTFQMVQTL